jgi:hypothetical protein
MQVLRNPGGSRDESNRPDKEKVRYSLVSSLLPDLREAARVPDEAQNLPALLS